MKYVLNNSVRAFIKISIDPVDNYTIWIDEFEVIKEYRKTGIGKSAIQEFVIGADCDIKLLAKSKEVQLFWKKCGFQDEDVTWTEIPMIYKVKRK